MKLAKDSDNYIKVGPIRELSDSGYGAPASVTSVSAKILDSDGEVTDSSITLTTITGKSNVYEGSFPSTLSLTLGSATVEVTIEADDLKRVIRQPVTII